MLCHMTNLRIMTFAQITFIGAMIILNDAPNNGNNLATMKRSKVDLEKRPIGAAYSNPLFNTSMFYNMFYDRKPTDTLNISLLKIASHSLTMKDKSF